MENISMNFTQFSDQLVKKVESILKIKYQQFIIYGILKTENNIDLFHTLQKLFKVPGIDLITDTDS